MARPSFRVHFVSHPDGMLTGRLLARDGDPDKAPVGFGASEEQVLSQLQLAVEELEGAHAGYLWRDDLHTRSVRVHVHPQAV